VSPQCGHQPVRLWRSGTGADAVLRLLRAIRSEVCHFQSANLCNFHPLLTNTGYQTIHTRIAPRLAPAQARQSSELPSC